MIISSVDQAERRRGFRSVFILVAFTLTGWLTGAVWPRLLVMLGIYDYGTIYLDSYALLAALDAVRAGADPLAFNALDPLLRHHVYSDWWLGLHWLGLNRSHNFILGTAWVGAFALTAWATVRPRNLGESSWLVALMISPPVMLAVNRANNDLVMFILLAAIGLAANSTRWWRPLLAIVSLTMATGLKYYPAPAALALLWIRPVGKVPVVLLSGLTAVGLAFISVWGDIERSRFVIGSGVYTMGAPLWWRDIGWSDANSAVAGFLLIVAAAVLLAWSKVTVGLATHGEPADRLRGALGAIIILTCFAAGVNYAYRWIFILWPAIWVWRLANDISRPWRQLWAARVAGVLIGLCLWLDGLFCIIINLQPPRDSVWLEHAQFGFRQWTQPLHWMLMMLLAGWLLEGAWVAWQTWRNERQQ